MLNVTNDAWYGRSSGPYQHFAIARTRAVEEGLPLVRVANNGISGVIDPAGRVVARTRLDSIGYADVALPEAAAPTLYSRAGDWLFLALLLLGLVPSRWAIRRASQSRAEMARLNRNGVIVSMPVARVSVRLLPERDSLHQFVENCCESTCRMP